MKHGLIVLMLLLAAATTNLTAEAVERGPLVTNLLPAPPHAVPKPSLWNFRTPVLRWGSTYPFPLRYPV